MFKYEVKSGARFGVWDWIWYTLSIAFAIIIVLFTFNNAFQDSVMMVINIPGATPVQVGIVALLIWFTAGHNTLTITFALIEEWLWWIYVLIAVAALAFCAAFFPPFLVTLKYLWNNSGNAGLYLIAIVVLILIQQLWKRVIQPRLVKNS